MPADQNRRGVGCLPPRRSCHATRVPRGWHRQGAVAERPQPRLSRRKCPGAGFVNRVFGRGTRRMRANAHGPRRGERHVAGTVTAHRMTALGCKQPTIWLGTHAPYGPRQVRTEYAFLNDIWDGDLLGHIGQGCPRTRTAEGQVRMPADRRERACVGHDGAPPRVVVWRPGKRMTRAPDASTSTVAPGGTTVVLSRSSTMAGPAMGAMPGASVARS